MAVPSRSRRRAPTANGILTLLTDFGTADAFVGIMKGVILGMNRRARLVDLSHEVEPQNVLAGALLLRSAVDYFPRGTVHLVVVDPGVGSDRQALAIATTRAIFVGPDNGVLWPAAERLGLIRAHAVDCKQLARRKVVRLPVSRTFHGRDVFAPVAAYLSGGAPISSVGPTVDRLVELDIPACRVIDAALEGEVIHIDRFGNLITNIPAVELARFSEGRVSVSINGVQLRGILPSYAAVPEGRLLAVIGSWDLLEIAVRGGSAANRLGASRHAPVRVAAA
jgi:S-adenosyl-L-methionine hydrolase (adenosine-forming)